MKKLFTFLTVLIVIVATFSTLTLAQTNPALQLVPHSQTFSITSTSTVYPTGWQGWVIGAAAGSSFNVAGPTANSNLITSATAATTTAGVLNYNGKIGILPSASIDPGLCLGLTTTGKTNIQITFDVMTIRNPYDGSANTCINGMDLQYRIGTAGVWTSVSGLVNGFYQNNTTLQTSAVTTAQNLLNKIFVLPAACDNQPSVYLRWVMRDISGSGNRPGLAIDNVIVCSLVTPSLTISGPTAFCTGNSAVYTATPTNGGNNPSYQWRKNGVNVGTNSPVYSVVGLLVGDQIRCLLTSNASCLTTSTSTSNIILIGTVVNAPSISLNAINNVTCTGLQNGSIDISVLGGTPPYSVCWDTVNRVNGPAFAVSVGPKTGNNPLIPFGGNPNSFIIDGTQAKELTLTKGIMYTFNVLSPAHPFHISTDFPGGNANFIITNGQTGAPTTSGTVTFTPDNTHPTLLYYPCQNHTYMGWRINITDGYCVEDPVNLKAGEYTVIVKDANGCTASAQYSVSELPSPIILSAAITDATCSFGSIDLSISNGTPPYTVLWDTINTTNGNVFTVTVGGKTITNPYFLLGNPSCFYIDGEEAKELSLVKGIDYSFNVFSPSHPWHISTDSIGGTTAGLVTEGQFNAPNDNGTVEFIPDNSHPSLLRYNCANHQYMGANIHVVDGYLTEDLAAVHTGTYSVLVTDATGCSQTGTFTVGQGTSSVITSLLSTTNASCYGLADGVADITSSGGINPYSSFGMGPTFIVTDDIKNHSHPQYSANGPGSSGFVIDGIQGKEFTLIRGITYTFSVLSPSHEFFITTDIVGGPGNTGNAVTDGVTNNFVSTGTLTFTPNSSHPTLLYYQCGIHDYMGWKIHIVDQGLNGDLINAMAGDYSIFTVDANGCNSPTSLDFVIGEPLAAVFYFDEDNDGYGANAETAFGCTPLQGFVNTNTDCDDGNPAINPGVTEICGNFIDDDCDGLVDNGQCGIVINLKLFIEGYYLIGGTMVAAIDPFIHPTLCDTVVVCLAETTSPYNILYSITGTINTSGQGSFAFSQNLAGNSYYILIRHRNALETWSGAPVLMSALTNYDFSTSISQAFGNNMIESFDQNGWCFYSGDVADGTLGILGLQDRLIESQDYLEMENAVSAIVIGYTPADITGDGVVESADYLIMENNVSAIIFTMQP